MTLDPDSRMEAIAEGGTFKLLARGAMLLLTVVVVPAFAFFGVRTLATLDRQAELLQVLTTKVEVLNATVAYQLQDRYTAKDAVRDHESQKIVNDAIDYRLRQLEQRHP